MCIPAAAVAVEHRPVVNKAGPADKLVEAMQGAAVATGLLHPVVALAVPFEAQSLLMQEEELKPDGLKAAVWLVSLHQRQRASMIWARHRQM